MIHENSARRSNWSTDRSATSFVQSVVNFCGDSADLITQAFPLRVEKEDRLDAEWWHVQWERSVVETLRETGN